jgi:hypothetical protein
MHWLWQEKFNGSLIPCASAISSAISAAPAAAFILESLPMGRQLSNIDDND